jgi:hypothetical protein
VGEGRPFFFAGFKRYIRSETRFPKRLSVRDSFECNGSETGPKSLMSTMGGTRTLMQTALG